MSMNAQEEFWKWFIQNEVDLFNFEADRERIFDQLSAALQKVDSDLTFEFGSKEAKREFVVSAGGIKSAFPSVVSLASAAPPLARWRVTAFRPRRTPPEVVEFRGKKVRPKDVQFSLLDNGKIAGVRLFIPSFQEDDLDWKQVGYLLLDDTLGEYDVESRLGLIKMYPADTQNSEKRYPLAELPVAFDRLVSRLEGHSEKPS